jgi:glycosyltransferase involved in cell wall biosynthesis
VTGHHGRIDGDGLRVLLACEWFVKYTAGLARGLADVGCEVTLLTRDHDFEFGDREGAMRAFVAETLGGKATHLELGGRVRDPSRLPELLRLRRRLRRWKPDVTHVQDSLGKDLRLMFAAGVPGRKYAITIHDPAPHIGEDEHSTSLRLARGNLMRRADLVFAHADVLADELRETGQIRGPVEVIPHGFGAVDAAPLPERRSLLFFGRVMPYKGVDTLLDAMPLVWEKAPDVTLTVAGSSDGSLARHPVLADPRVSLRDEHVAEAEVPGLFAECTCVVLPYRQATQSGVGAEARQFGRALVVTDVGGLPDLVDAGSGRLVPSEDPPALAAAIVEIIDTPGLAEALGRGATAANGEAGWPSVAATTVAAYRRYLL